MSSVSADPVLEQRVADCLVRAVSSGRIVGGVVLVARDGHPIIETIAGDADRESGRKMTAGTIFRYSSLTKPIVAAATMALVERGVTDLDDSIARWLPEFRPRLPDGELPEIRVHHLLTHTAGLGYRMLQPPGGPYEQAGVSDGLDESVLSIDEQLERLAHVPLDYPPGTAWGYSVAYDVLGALIARAAGATLPEVIARTVTAPLGMRDTAFSVVDPARLAVPYVPARPPRIMGDPELVPYLPGTAGIRFSPSRIFKGDAFTSGGAGMAGTAHDFLKLLLALQSDSGPLLQATSAREMRINHIGALRLTAAQQPAWAFGFGGAVLMEPEIAGTPQGVGTWQWGGVYGHHWYVDPANRVTVVALTNTAIEGMMGGFVADLMQAVYGAPSR